MPAVHLMSDQSLQVSAHYLALGGAFLGSPSRIGSAVGMLEHAVAAAPDNWVAHANLAVARLHTGQDDLSVASSVQSIEVAILMCIPSHCFICIAYCHTTTILHSEHSAYPLRAPPGVPADWHQSQSCTCRDMVVAVGV